MAKGHHCALVTQSLSCFRLHYIDRPISSPFNDNMYFLFPSVCEFVFSFDIHISYLQDHISLKDFCCPDFLVKLSFVLLSYFLGTFGS